MFLLVHWDFKILLTVKSILSKNLENKRTRWKHQDKTQPHQIIFHFLVTSLLYFQVSLGHFDDGLDWLCAATEWWFPSAGFWNEKIYLPARRSFRHTHSPPMCWKERWALRKNSYIMWKFRWRSDLRVRRNQSTTMTAFLQLPTESTLSQRLELRIPTAMSWGKISVQKISVLQNKKVKYFSALHLVFFWSQSRVLPR